MKYLIKAKRLDPSIIVEILRKSTQDTWHTTNKKGQKVLELLCDRKSDFSDSATYLSALRNVLKNLYVPVSYLKKKIPYEDFKNAYYCNIELMVLKFQLG